MIVGNSEYTVLWERTVVFALTLWISDAAAAAAAAVDRRPRSDRIRIVH
jgi:hypothetical protein